MNSKIGKKDFYIESISPDRRWVAMFEDDKEAGYMYLSSCKENGEIDKVVDHLWIYNKLTPSIQKCNVVIVWSNDSTKVVLIVDNKCLGMFDLHSKRKLNASRENDVIVSIPREKWDKGINAYEGDVLKI